MSDLMLVTGLASVAIALLVLALIVVPGGPGRVPISRLDPTAAIPATSRAGGVTPSSGAGGPRERRRPAGTG